MAANSLDTGGASLQAANEVYETWASTGKCAALAAGNNTWDAVVQGLQAARHIQKGFQS